MAKKLTHKVIIIQSGVTATFRLSDKEMDGLCASSQDRDNKSYGRCHDSAMYAFFEHETTRSKYDRFIHLFGTNDHNRGDFFWDEIK